jgi:hypothetical protein
LSKRLFHQVLEQSSNSQAKKERDDAAITDPAPKMDSKCASNNDTKTEVETTDNKLGEAKEATAMKEDDDQTPSKVVEKAPPDDKNSKEAPRKEQPPPTVDSSALVNKETTPASKETDKELSPANHDKQPLPSLLLDDAPMDSESKKNVADEISPSTNASSPQLSAKTDTSTKRRRPLSPLQPLIATRKVELSAKSSANNEENEVADDESISQFSLGEAGPATAKTIVDTTSIKQPQDDDIMSQFSDQTESITSFVETETDAQKESDDTRKRPERKKRRITKSIEVAAVDGQTSIKETAATSSSRNRNKQTTLSNWVSRRQS